MSDTSSADYVPADLHGHTIASGHAFSTLDEMARTAAARGLRVLGITDHGPSMEGAARQGVFEMVDRLPACVHGVLLLFGCEANIIDTTGKLDLPDEWARRQRLLLAGLHERTPWPASTSRADNTRAILGALQNPAVHVIAHPYRPQFPIDVDTVVDAAVEHRKLLEINVSIFRGDLANAAAAGGDETVRATRCMLQRLQEKNGEFVVSTDAHHSSEVGVERRTLEALGALLEFDAERYRKNVMSMLQRQVPYLRDAARAAA